jgi:hypothetical protein
MFKIGIRRPDAGAIALKINLPLSICVLPAASSRSTRKCTASLRLTAAFAMDRVVFMAQRFRRIT